jgi:hypothetical protein
MRTLQQINAAFRGGGSRQGQCNSPHPDPRYRRTVQVIEIVPGSKVPAMPEGVGRPVLKEYSTVSCSRYAGHDIDGDPVCTGWAFSIKVPDSWPTPADRNAWPTAAMANQKVVGVSQNGEL